VTVRVVDADGTVRLVTVEVRVAGTTQARSAPNLPDTGTPVVVPSLIGTALLLAGTAAVWTTRGTRLR
jgi:LPXTG-motif cell wall-anchored protein